MFPKVGGNHNNFKTFEKRSLQDWEHWWSFVYFTAEKFCLLPIHFDKKTQTLGRTKDRTRIVVWFALLIYYILDTLYQLRVFLILAKGEFSMQETLTTVMHGFSRAAALGVTLGCLTNFDSTIQLLNGLRRFHREMKSKCAKHFKVHLGAFV